MSQYREALQKASGGEAARQHELADKQDQLANWLHASGHTGILLRRHENLSWVSAGQIEARVAILSETAIVALLILADGRRFSLAPNNEAARLDAEELAGLGFEPIVRPWYSLNVAAEAAAIAGTALVADAPAGTLPVVDLGPLRAPLHPSEQARLRVLGRATADIVAHALLSLEPGTTEHAMEARVAERLLLEGIFPSVLLMAADARILRYKHAVARDQTLVRYGMLNLCARRWGMVVSITRFVHFGPLPPELRQGFAAAATVNAALQHASRSGVTSDSLFRTAAEAYTQAGFAGEEQLHHQGGPCGYLEREWVAAPGGQQVVAAPQAFAWNPSSHGGKVEDTTLAVDNTIELLTGTPQLPQVLTEVQGVPYLSAGPLIRE